MNSVNFYPKTDETLLEFARMLQMENEDKPIVEMNDETARDMKVIWDSIQASAAHWRGKSDMRFPGMPTNRQELWGFFSQGNLERLPVAEAFIENTNGQNKTAIDLGCGNSPLVPLLLKKGWRVIAVDSSEAALEVLRLKNKIGIESGQLTVIKADVVSFIPTEPVDLVIAADVFPYIDPSEFQATWKRIHEIFVKKNGFFIGSLFRYPVAPGELSKANTFKEMGAWFLQDRRMVRPLLTQTGYDIKECKFRIEKAGIEPVCIQFVAEKK